MPTLVYLKSKGVLINFALQTAHEAPIELISPILMDRVEIFAWHEYVQTEITTRQSHANIGTHLQVKYVF
jgi:hypothetical protein